MGFQVDLKEFKEVLEKLQKDTSKTNEQLEQAKNALNGIIQADAMQGETGNAIVNDINNNQNAVVIGLKDTNKILIREMVTTFQDFQSTTGETDENAVILEDALLQTQNKLSNLQPKKHELDSRISNIYNSVSDLISLSMPNSQFDEKLVAASKELEDTIQKVQQFESKKAESNAENILNALNKQVQIAGDMGSLSYTDPQLRAFFAQDALAKGIHEMDTQITNAEKEAKLEAEREMKKKQEEWAENHPLEAWLQDLSKSAGEKWDVLRKGTKWVGDNIPLLKDLSDKALVLEGFIGAAGSAISGIAIGATKLGFLIAELGEWGFNSIRGVETEQWKLDDIYGAGNTIKSLGQAIISWQDYPKYGKALVNSVKGYVEKALTDPYALGGAIFDIGSCFIGVGEVTAAVKGTAAFGKFAEGTKVFQAAAKSGKIVGKLEEITALMNKLPRNALEKIKNIEIPSFGPKTALASAGHGGGGGLDSLKDVYQSMKENGKEFFGKATGEGRGLDSLKDVYQFMKENGEKVFGKGTGDTDHPIRTYRDVDLQNIDPVYIADQRTVVEMPFGGKGEKYTNAEGWRRDLKYFWRELLDRHPEAFSPNNRAIIEGRNPFTDSPVNDKVFREYFSQYDVKGVRGDKLVHHHIGGGGQAFPVPQKLHPGSGGIHNIEKEAGIWGKDKVYSELLQKLIKE
ncbi:T7SS effector LXG polymorphic toxin [Bacillus pseudomycoides]|uniref:T7SS effector LXG polymorphic toxin n=1 Tax=Bacillus pseudomycoides TaxID=64104 RepID=UPI0023D9B94A|nr:T7SS effector LXG polymorphic toxin [Bacillus pseudomycoides]MDF2082110.1 T7SS effector LXG polymorphic toxin [Bacillus pseudomycoides]